jgi:hypothetical protein
VPPGTSNAWISLPITWTGSVAPPFHVRSNQVHSVVEAQIPPERVMNDFKAYAGRRLNGMGLDGTKRKRWARHGSTRWLWKQHISAAMQYVVAEQGAAMSVFESHELP